MGLLTCFLLARFMAGERNYSLAPGLQAIIPKLLGRSLPFKLCSLFSWEALISHNAPGTSYSKCFTLTISSYVCSWERYIETTLL
uniref:Secreted protein n=1 Tax=Picea glauca TaxID=3330 RepID=A0A117NGC2_PICGL|nr:hypothetical protein ABT39_MTgene1669 [Picea glauca]QHR91879.1 hypothetical protein Q903MT_gene5915 [Picea sitchensis]